MTGANREFLVSKLHVRKTDIYTKYVFTEHITKTAATVDGSDIQRNVAGIPIFPKVDLEQLAPAAVLELLKKFLSTLWCML